MSTQPLVTADGSLILTADGSELHVITPQPMYLHRVRVGREVRAVGVRYESRGIAVAPEWRIVRVP